MAKPVLQEGPVRKAEVSNRDVKEAVSDGLDDAAAGDASARTGLQATIPTAPTVAPSAGPMAEPAVEATMAPPSIPMGMATAVPTLPMGAPQVDPCDPSVVMQVSMPVVFEANAQGCGFNAQGNGAPVNGVVSARQQRTVSLALPPGAKVCGLRISAPTQAVNYDDEFFLLLGNAVVASSQNYNDLFATRSGAPVFDWSKLMGAASRLMPTPYCFGAAEKLSTCVIPQNGTMGEFSLRFDDASIRKVLEGPGAPALSLGFVVIGDDDATDCQNGRIELQADVKFAPAK